MLISLTQSAVLRNVLEAVSQEHGKMKPQVGQGLLDPLEHPSASLPHLLQAVK